MTSLIDSGKVKEAKSYLPKFHSQLMKIAKTGVVSKKTASRKISRLTKKISKKKIISRLTVDIYFQKSKILNKEQFK